MSEASVYDISDTINEIYNLTEDGREIDAIHDALIKRIGARSIDVELEWTNLFTTSVPGLIYLGEAGSTPEKYTLIAVIDEAKNKVDKVQEEIISLRDELKYIFSDKENCIEKINKL